MTTFNIGLMKQVREATENQRFNQGTWRDTVVLTHPQTGEALKYPVDAADIDFADIDLSQAELAQRCSTTMCTAGWAAELDPRVEWALNDQEATLYTLEGLNYDREEVDDNATATYVTVTDPELWQEVTERCGEPVRLQLPEPRGGTVLGYHVEQVAQVLLGLDKAQAGYLFSGDREVEDIQAFLDMAIDDEPVPSESVPDVIRAVHAHRTRNAGKDA